MAITQVYTAVPNDVITAARWNNEFGNIYNNGTRLAFPVTETVSFAGFTLTLDSAGVTTLSTSVSQGFILTSGAKAGTPNTTGKTVNIVANTFTDSATSGSGTATSWAGVAIQRPTLVASNTLVTTTDAATVYIANSPLASTNETITNPWSLWVDDGNVRFDGQLRVDGVLRVDGFLQGTLALGKHIYGLTFDPGTDAVNDLDITVGGAVSDDASALNKRLMTLTSALTKQSDVVWAVGSAAGMLDTGAVGNNDYYLWLIMRADTGVVDVLCSLSSTAPTMPTNYSYKRQIGWFKRVGGTIVDFLTYETAGGGLEFLWVTPTLDINLASTLTTSRRTDAVKVPLNISTLAHLHVRMQHNAGSLSIVYCPDMSDLTPSPTAAPLTTFDINNATVGELAANITIRTSATGTIAARATTATQDSYRVSTLGFTMSRR